MVANGALLGSLAGSILELSETYKCGSIVRGLSRRITVRAPPTPGSGRQQSSLSENTLEIKPCISGIETSGRK